MTFNELKGILWRMPRFDPDTELTVSDTGNILRDIDNVIIEGSDITIRLKDKHDPE